MIKLAVAGFTCALRWQASLIGKLATLLGLAEAAVDDASLRVHCCKNEKMSNSRVVRRSTHPLYISVPLQLVLDIHVMAAIWNIDLGN